MWIRILGILYNLSLVQAIEYCTKRKVLYLDYGACGTHQNGYGTHTIVEREITEINFALPQYGNEYGLAVYKQLIEQLGVYDHDPVESDRALGIAGPPYEGAHPDAEFIEG